MLPSAADTYTTGSGNDNGTHTFTGVVLASAGAGTIVATDTATKTLTGSASVTVTPGATASLKVSAPATATSGQTISATVTAYDAAGNLTVTKTITGSASVTVTRGAPAMLEVSAPATAVSGQTISVTVTACDAGGNVAPGYTGMVNVASSDYTDTLPNAYTFTAADKGVHTFTGLVLNSMGYDPTDSDTIVANDTAQFAGLTAGTATVTVAAPASLKISASTATVTAGQPLAVTVTVLDALGNVAIGYTGSLQLASGDFGDTRPAAYQLTPADKGVHTFSVMLATVNVDPSDSDGVTAEATQASGTQVFTPTPAVVTVTPGAVTHFAVAGPSTVVSGDTMPTYTVSALNAYNQPVETYTGKVIAISSDAKAVLLPAPFQYTSGISWQDDGVHVFKGLVLNTAGSQTLTFTDTASKTITGSSTVTVSPGNPASLSVSAPASAISGQTVPVTVTAFDGAGNVATGYKGTILLTSSSGGDTLPAAYRFTPASQGVHVFSVTVTGSGSALDTVTATPTVHTTFSLTVARKGT